MAENMLVLAPESAVPMETDSETKNHSASEISEKAADASGNTAVAWLDDKAYAVSVKPADEMPADAPEHETNSVNLPVKVLDEKGNEKKQPQTTVFGLDGKEYAIQVTELSPEEIPAGSSADPVVWIDKVPLQVNLANDSAAAGTVTDPKLQMDINLQITLNPLPAEQTAALQQERFGADPVSPVPADEDPFPTAAEEPTPTATEEPQEENWFGSFFSNLFGASPTETPTPQVTVIALTPTPTLPQPTATPLVILMAPTAEAQGPVRLDGEGGSSSEPVKPTATMSSNEPKISDGKTTSESEKKTAGKAAGSEESGDTKSGKTSPSKLDAVVVDSFDKPEYQQPQAQQTPETKELPHTGGLEGWNIPSLLIMLAGLLLVIIGVRRLRSR